MFCKLPRVLFPIKYLGNRASYTTRISQELEEHLF